MGSMLTIICVPDVAVNKVSKTDVVDFAQCKLVNEFADPKLTAVTLKVRTLWRRTKYLGESTSLQTSVATRLLHDVCFDESSACYV